MKLLMLWMKSFLSLARKQMAENKHGLSILLRLFSFYEPKNYLKMWKSLTEHTNRSITEAGL